jgi:hypothetical protein
MAVELACPFTLNRNTTRRQLHWVVGIGILSPSGPAGIGPAIFES